MLILVRKPGQAFSISGGITVTVLEVGRDRVKLGIDAPPAVRVLRDELIERTAAGVGGGAVDRTHAPHGPIHDQRAARGLELCAVATEAGVRAQQVRLWVRQTRRVQLKAKRCAPTALVAAA